jgi:enoyl-CoA hydratase
MPRARQLAETIASMAPLAIAHCIAAVNEGADLPLDRALAHEASRFGLCCATADKAEGTAAFLAKRPPTWSGK